MGLYHCLGKGGEGKKRQERIQEGACTARASVTKISTRQGRWVPQVYPTVFFRHRERLESTSGGVAWHIDRG